MTQPFQAFGPDHWAALFVGAIVMAWLVLTGRSSARGRNLAAAVLAFPNLASYAFNQIAWSREGGPPSVEQVVPLHLCDVAAVTAGFALITRWPLLQTLTYFWGLAAALQALITPALSTGFPAWPYFAFFIQHVAIVAAALFIPLVDGWRPKLPLWKSPFEAYLGSVVYMASALAANAWLGTNFGFLSQPPQSASLFDHLGPWPWYLLALHGVGFGLYLLLVLPLARCAMPPSHADPVQRPRP
jgi:hypothetical integral membrane protein (TIGR02206 family)